MSGPLCIESEKTVLSTGKNELWTGVRAIQASFLTTISVTEATGLRTEYMVYKTVPLFRYAQWFTHHSTRSCGRNGKVSHA